MDYIKLRALYDDHQISTTGGTMIQEFRYDCLQTVYYKEILYKNTN